MTRRVATERLAKSTQHPPRLFTSPRARTPLCRSGPGAFSQDATPPEVVQTQPLGQFRDC